MKKWESKLITLQSCPRMCTCTWFYLLSISSLTSYIFGAYIIKSRGYRWIFFYPTPYKTNSVDTSTNKIESQSNKCVPL